MPFTACQTQTLNKNNKDTHYKNKHPHTTNPHPTNKTGGTGPTVRAMLASTIHKSNNKRPTRATATHPGHRVLMPQNPNSVPEAEPTVPHPAFHTRLANEHG